jgi:predicted permease
MNSFKPLRAALFIYECIRLGVLVGLFIQLAPDGGAVPFPMLVYTVPNALFLLMALFLLFSPEKYEAYASLYLAGKCISLFSLLLWFIISRSGMYTAQLLENPAVFVLLRALLFMFTGEALSIIGSTVLIKKGKRG